MYLRFICFVCVVVLCAASSFSASAAAEEVCADSYYNPGRVSINLMWLNKERNDGEKYIFPESKRYSLVKAVKRWFRLHPEEDTSFNFWYDSKTVTDDQIEATVEVFRVICDPFQKPENKKKAWKAKKWHLEDIQDLDLVIDDQHEIFSKASVHFRADILRWVISNLIVGDEETHLEKADTFIYADLQITPEDRSYLFSKDTQDSRYDIPRFLKKYGFVMLRNDKGEKSDPEGGALGFENGFMITTKNPLLTECVSRILVGPSLEIAIRISQEYSLIGVKGYPPLAQSIYDGIQHMFLYLMYRKEEINLVSKHKKNDAGFWIPKPSEVTKLCYGNLSWTVHDYSHPLGDNGNVLTHKHLTMVTQAYYARDEIKTKEQPLLSPMPCIRMIGCRSHFG